MTITAKFASICPKCSVSIIAGDRVNWTPGSMATHVVCPAIRNEGDCEHPVFHKWDCKCARRQPVARPQDDPEYDMYLSEQEMDRDDASYMAWLAFQASKPVARLAVEEAGVYVMPNGDIVKVQANSDKSRTYAKRWVVINGERLNENDDHVRGEYVYEQGLVQQVAQFGRKMTLDEAKAFILRYGQCARCSRKLKAALSVERGIGPICVRYFSDGITAADLMGLAA